jgi:hypothetical protein
MRNIRLSRILLPFLFVLSYGFSQTPFSTDSATAYLRTIAVDIGARPMGSPNERRVAEFAIAKFREYGLTEAYVMPIREYPGFNGNAPTNTQSGVAIGVLKGATNRIIMLGAHMDSADPNVPGANDDGSGCAVILELARILAHRTNESTIVFALFGGEEAGLQGSKYFVDHYPDIDRVALMLQADMANGSPLLFPTLDASHGSSPEWLVRASYEEFSKLGHTGLHFPTDFFVFMGSLPGGGVGSDHEPFLERNIPAIDFTSDARDPIHTAQDNFENFKTAGLKRSGDLIFKLVERFDAGVPGEKTGKYLLYQFGPYPLFIPLWMLWVFVGIALVVGIAALILVRRRTDNLGGAAQPKIPGLKMFLLMLIIQACVWLSENVVAFMKGVRFPWMSDITGYFVLAFLAACVGIWLSLRLSPKLHLRHDAYSYFLRAFILLALIVILSSFSSAKLALYPATAIFLLGLAMIVKQPILKFVFWLLSPHFMFRLFFSEGFDFLARILHTQPDITPVINAAFVAVLALFFSVWAFPFLLGFSAVFFDSKIDVRWLSFLKRKTAGALVLSLFVIAVVVLSLEPSYSQEWKPALRVEETFNLDSLKGDITLKGTEYLSGTHLKFAGLDTTLHESSTAFTLANAISAPTIPWVLINRIIHVSKADSIVAVELTLRVDMQYRPFKLKITYSNDRGKVLDVASPFALGTSDRSFTLQWSAFQDTSLTIPVSFKVNVRDSLRVKERIEAVFVEEPQPITVETRQPTAVSHRSVFTRDTVVWLQ